MVSALVCVRARGANDAMTLQSAERVYRKKEEEEA